MTIRLSRCCIRPPNRGIALVLVLFLVAFLFIFGVLFMISLDRDVQFQSRAELEARAYYLALGGIDYCRYHVVRPNVATLGPIAVGERGYFEVTAEADGTVRSRGYILNLNGSVLAEKSLVAPQGSMRGHYVP